MTDSSSSTFKNFHHLGVAVKDFSKATLFYQSLGYQSLGPIEDKIQNVELLFLSSPLSTSPNIELVKPINAQSPVNTYLKTMNEAFYHTCYEVTSVHEAFNQMKKEFNTICISPPKPAILFNNRLVSFYYLKDIGLVELLEK